MHHFVRPYVASVRSGRAIRHGTLHAAFALVLAAAMFPLVAAPSWADPAPTVTPTATARFATPVGSASLWVDVESSDAASSVTRIRIRPDAGAPTEASVTVTPFGVSAAFVPSQGSLRLDIAAGTPTSADIALTFADESGLILDERLLRSVSINPGTADRDGWISITESDGASPSPPRPDASDAPGGTPAQGTLPGTGSDTTAWRVAALGAGVALIAVGLGAAAIARRRARTNAGALQHGEEQ